MKKQPCILCIMLYTVSTHMTHYVYGHTEYLYTIGEGRLNKLNNTWKDGWILFKRDLRQDRLYLIWNVIFMIYTAFMISGLATPTSRAGELMSPIGDFILLLVMPITGFYFSKRSINYIKEDSYTRMLHYYRTLPIPAITVMKGRVIQLLTALLFNGLFFYPVFYLVTGLSDGPIKHIGELLAFALTWTGYGLFINGIYIYFEFMNRGQKYFWISMVIMVAMAILTFLIHSLGGNVLVFTLEQSKRYSLLSPIMWGSLIIGGVNLALWCKITLTKLGKRDLI